MLIFLFNVVGSYFINFLGEVFLFHLRGVLSFLDNCVYVIGLIIATSSGLDGRVDSSYIALLSFY